MDLSSAARPCGERFLERHSTGDLRGRLLATGVFSDGTATNSAEQHAQQNNQRACTVGDKPLNLLGSSPIRRTRFLDAVQSA